MDRHDSVAMKRSIKRAELLPLFADRPPCLIGMEACAGAHHWARELSRLGHTVRLMAPKHVKPYLKGQKNDANDAAAICEAVSRPNMRFVAIKSVAQQDAQALHRIRSQCVEHRTAKVNLIRGLLAEYGIVIAQQVSNLRRALVDLLEDAENGLTVEFRELLSGLREDVAYLDHRIAELTHRIERHVQDHEATQRLLTLPGVGPISASALYAAVGDATAFANGRQLAAFLASRPGSIPPVAKPNCWVFTSKATVICAACWSTARERCSVWRSRRPMHAAPGSTTWADVATRTSPRWRRPTKPHGLPG